MDTAKVMIGIVIEDSAGKKVLLIKEKIKKKDQPLWNVIKDSHQLIQDWLSGAKYSLDIYKIGDPKNPL